MEVETVFGQIKTNRMFNRFRMKSIKKVEIEFVLLAMAYNILKMKINRVRYPVLYIICSRNILKKIELKRAV